MTMKTIINLLNGQLNNSNQTYYCLTLWIEHYWSVMMTMMMIIGDFSDCRLIWCSDDSRHYSVLFNWLIWDIHKTRDKSHVPRRKQTTAEQKSTSWLNAKANMQNWIWMLLLLLRNDFINRQGANLIRCESSIITLRELFRSKAHAKCFWLMESLWRWTLQHLILPDQSN